MKSSKFFRFQYPPPLDLSLCSEDLYKLLRETLIVRVKDKEVPIRVQATIALSRICGADEEDEKPTIIDILEETVQYDPSAYVPPSTDLDVIFLLKGSFTVKYDVQPFYTSLWVLSRTLPS